MVTAEVYQDIIRDFIALLEPEEQYCHFQQDEEHSHIAAEMITFLRLFQWMFSVNDIRSPHSLNLSVADFFLRGYIKTEAFHQLVRMIEELKARITTYIAQITSATLKNVFRNLVRKVKTSMVPTSNIYCNILLNKHFSAVLYFWVVL